MANDKPDFALLIKTKMQPYQREVMELLAKQANGERIGLHLPMNCGKSTIKHMWAERLKQLRNGKTEQ